MIINLLKHLTKKTKCVNIASDGCRNPEIGGNNDIVILNTDLTSYRRVAIHYTRLSRLLEGKMYRVDQFRLSNNPAYFVFRKLKLETTMSNIISFNFNNLEVRTTLINDEPYFCLKDVCTALDIKNNRDSISRLKEDGVATTDVIDKIGRKQQANFINESNLFRLIFQSRKETALEFQDWVFDEVLPTLRKTGSYTLADSRQLCSTSRYLKAPNLPEPLNCLEFIALDPNYTHERECYWCPVICRCPHYPVSEVAQVATKTSNYLEEILSVMASYPKHGGLLDKVLYDMLYTHRPEDEYFNYSMLSKISTKLFQYYQRENERRNIA